jgi:putative ABC transport system ATP-binding protein
MQMAAIEAKHLNKSYKVGKITTQVLFDVDLAIQPGELTLLVGPSGCGKSTLLALLSGLTEPDTGDVKALGQSIWSLSRRKRDRFRLDHLGFIFQGFNLFAALTATEQVAWVLEQMGTKGREAKARAEAVLDTVGLSARKHLRPAELSGGEKQRVAIARAFAKHPRLLFADEPTSALDSKNGIAVIKLLQRIAHEDGAATLCVTHDPRLLDYGDRILTMEDGRLIRDERRNNAVEEDKLHG